MKDKNKNTNWTTQYVTLTKEQKEIIKKLAKENFRTNDGQIRYMIDKFINDLKVNLE